MADVSAWQSYRVLIGSRIRSQLTYRTSFVINTLSSAGIGIIEFTETYVILTRVPLFGGLNLPQAALVFALSNLGFAVADMIFGQLDTVPTMLRMGRIEALLVRPMPLMRLAFSPDETTAARVLAEVSAQVEVVDLTLEEPAIEDIVRTLYAQLSDDHGRTAEKPASHPER